MDWDVYIPQRMIGSINMDTGIRNVSGVEQSSPMPVPDVLYHLTDDMNCEQPSAKAEGFFSKHHYFDFLLQRILHRFLSYRFLLPCPP